MGEWDLAISPQTLVEQINEAGADWGLVGEYDEAAGRVFVCEKSPHAEVCYGVADATETVANRRICSVDDVATFARALANRVTNFEAKAPQATRVAEGKRRQQAAIDADTEAFRHDIKSSMRLKLRGGERFFLHDASAEYRNRRERRIAEAVQRRQGG